MAMAISMQCGVRCTEYRLRARRRHQLQRIRARLTVFAVAAAALLLMAYAEQWMLQRAPTSANELTVAMYAVGALSGGAIAVDAPANDTNPEDEDIAR